MKGGNGGDGDSDGDVVDSTREGAPDVRVVLVVETGAGAGDEGITRLGTKRETVVAGPRGAPAAVAHPSRHSAPRGDTGERAACSE